jgi:hypothetical protein
VHESFLRYRRFRWLKVAVVGAAALVVLAFLPSVYARRDVVYGLGIAAAALMLWLFAFGFRKRHYSTTATPVSAWLSAHVYLGLLPLVLVPVHAAFRFGMNVHTLAFVLTAVVVLSGVVGALLYATIPAELTRNRPQGKFDELVAEIGTVDAECRALRAALPHDVAVLVDAALATEVGGGWLRARGQGAMRRALEVLRTDQRGERAATDRLLTLIGWRQKTFDRLGRELRLRSWLDGWLYVHMPLAFAAIAAIAVHVVVVLRYR